MIHDHDSINYSINDYARGSKSSQLSLLGFCADQDGWVGFEGARRPPIAGGVAIKGEEENPIGGVGAE